MSLAGTLLLHLFPPLIGVTRLESVLAGVRARSVGVIEWDRAAMLRALADEDALRVFGQVVVATGTGLPERSGGSMSVHYATAHALSRRTGLPVSAVVGALKRLTAARLTIENEDGDGWRTDFEALCRAADAQGDEGSSAVRVR